jgi:hypothetical protein
LDTTPTSAFRFRAHGASSEETRNRQGFLQPSIRLATCAWLSGSGLGHPPGHTAQRAGGIDHNGSVEEQPLSGGVANAGSVARLGNYVLRPRSSHAEAIGDLLESIARAGFGGVPRPAGVTPDGRDRFVYIAGNVPIPPYPEWSQTDEALASVAELLRRFHEVSRSYHFSGWRWSEEMADPEGGPLICHNDVCLENVVFEDGVAIGLLDFDFAAPGRTTYDPATFARMCVPIDDDTNAERNGWLPGDRPRRLRLIMDTYGLGAAERVEMFAEITRSMDRGGEFVRRRVRAGDPNFLKMWNEMGGEERFARRREWWLQNKDRYLAVIA